MTAYQRVSLQLGTIHSTSQNSMDCQPHVWSGPMQWKNMYLSFVITELKLHHWCRLQRQGKEVLSIKWEVSAWAVPKPLTSAHIFGGSFVAMHTKSNSYLCQRIYRHGCFFVSWISMFVALFVFLVAFLLSKFLCCVSRVNCLQLLNVKSSWHKTVSPFLYLSLQQRDQQTCLCL